MKKITITELIDIRNYIVLSLNNFNLDNTIAKELNVTLQKIDKKISELILGNDFQKLINKI